MDTVTERFASTYERAPLAKAPAELDLAPALT
jgi:hypothetical protein